eukprot:5851728-Alexandrium_andersonii.AAC.1
MEKLAGCISARKGFTTHCTPSHMAGDKPTAGTALLLKRPKPLFSPVPRTSAFKDMEAAGRVTMG